MALNRFLVERNFPTGSWLSINGAWKVNRPVCPGHQLRYLSEIFTKQTNKINRYGRINNFGKEVFQLIQAMVTKRSS
jgi:hypothetical protein